MRTILIILILSTVGINTVRACKCQGNENLKTEFKQSTLIVHGKVLSKSFISYAGTLSKEKLNLIREKYKTDTQKLEFLESKSILKIELEVKAIYKGNDVSKTIIVYTSKYGASCGYLGFKIGEEYLTYLSSTSYLEFMFGKIDSGTESSNGFWTNNCTRTKGFDKNEHDELRNLMTE